MASAFAQACAKKGKAWAKARKAKPRQGGTFGPADIKDGNYIARISTKNGISKKDGTPWVRLIATVAQGSSEGAQPSKFYFLEGKEPPPEGSDEQPTAEQQLAGTMKVLLPDVDIDNLDAAGIEQALAEIDNNNPLCRIGVTSGVGKATGKTWQEVYFNELVEGGSPNGQQVETEEVSETEEEGGEEAGEEEGEEAGDDESVAPAKGDKVLYQPKGGKKRAFEVTTVNQKKQTVTVVDVSGQTTKKFSDVPWDSLEAVEE
jgi:hypothetical protein